ncbi:MAG: hypothetical protein HQK49_13265 [Oligoflexia bacterium]|nr:hypothetical protein [Oligoflexia bacterium]
MESNQIQNINKDNLIKKHTDKNHHDSLKIIFANDTIYFNDKDVTTPNNINTKTHSKLVKTFGTIDADFHSWIINQLVSVFGTDTEKLASELNAVLVVLSGISPKNELECMLAVQTCITHQLAMESVRRANLPDQTSEGRSINMNRSVKLMNLFLQQTEGLERLKGKINQKIVVEHVTVNDGGKAIVGNISSLPDQVGRGE